MRGDEPLSQSGENGWNGGDHDPGQVKRHQLIQEVIGEIVTATNAIDDLYEFLGSVRNSLSKIINTRNFFVALYNKNDNTLTLPVFFDDVDQFKTFPAGRTLTAYMINENRPLLLEEPEMTLLEEKDIIDRIGSPCKSWLGVPLRMEGNVMGAIVLQSYTDDTVYDRTDMRTLQIIAEQISIAIDRKSRQEKLRESERAMKTLISNLPGVAYRCRYDSSWTMEFLSDGFTSLTGYPVESCLNNRDYCYSELIHQEDRGEVWDQVNEAVDKNEPYHLIYRIIISGGAVKWVWEKGRAVHDDNGNVIALEGFIIDITDRIEMEKQIIAAKEKAEESDRLKSSFLANLSHEIRSPMNSIMGFSQLLKSENVGEPLSQYIDIIFRSSRQLLNVIDDIVDMAKIDSGQMPVKKSDFSPSDLLNGLKKQAGEHLVAHGKRQVEFEVRVEGLCNGVIIHSDETLIRQVMIHLINNAIKFTDKGKIRIGCAALQGNKVRFYVRDTGIGISPLYHEIIFERFRQADERTARSYEGSGLGLSISKGIVNLLGGEIWVESSSGEGSFFCFTIPVS